MSRPEELNGPSGVRPPSPGLAAPASAARTGGTEDGRPLTAVVVPSLFLMVAMLNLTLIVAGLKELIVDELGGTVTHASLFFSIEMIAYIIFAPLWGLLSDRWGRRKPLIVVGFLVTTVLYTSYLFVDSVTTLLALRFVQGAFTVMGWSTLMALVLDQPDESRRGRYMGLMGGALILGVSIGAPLGGYLSRGLGVRAPLEVAAVLFLLLTLGSLALRDPRQVRRQVAVTTILTTLKQRPRLMLPLLFHFVDRFTVGFIVVLLPLYLAAMGEGSDPAVRGRYLGFFLLPFALLQYFFGRLSERVGPYRPLIIGSFLYGSLLCVVGYTGLFALGWVMFALGILAAVMFPPAITLTAQESQPETRGSAMGGFNLAGSLGFAVGPLVGVWAYESQGYGFAFVVSGSLEILAAITALLLLRRLQR